MAWCTISDVINLTGVSVNTETVTAAQSVIEIFAGTTEEASDAGNISSTNLRLLLHAVAYQAAWLASHPDAFATIDVQSASQDNISYTPAHANAQILAPMAKRCMDRLSWKRHRNIIIRKQRDWSGSIPLTNNYDSTARDDNDPRWEPLH